MRRKKVPLIFAGILLVVWGVLYEFSALNLFGVIFLILGFRGEETEENTNTLLAQRLKKMAEKTQGEEKEEKPKQDDEPLFNFEDNG